MSPLTLMSTVFGNAKLLPMLTLAVIRRGEGHIIPAIYKRLAFLHIIQHPKKEYWLSFLYKHMPA